MLRLFEHGSAGTAYLLKEHIGHRERLLEAIREVASGGSVVDPAVVDVLVEARLRARNSPLANLTPREREVLARVAQGKSNAAIATELFLTKRAIEKNINSIFSKLNLVNDTEVSRRVAATLLYLAEPLRSAAAPETVSVVDGSGHAGSGPYVGAPPALRCSPRASCSVAGGGVSVSRLAAPRSTSLRISVSATVASAATMQISH